MLPNFFAPERCLLLLVLLLVPVLVLLLVLLLQNPSNFLPTASSARLLVAESVVQA